MKITPPTNNAPSRKRTKLVIAALIAIIIAGLAWLLLHDREPSYNGKPFSLWLEKYSQQQHASGPTKEQQQAINALVKLGPKAVPVIIRTLEKNDSPMRNKYREAFPKMPQFLQSMLPKPKSDYQQFSATDAANTLRLLGTNTLGQLPELLQSGNPAVREAAAHNLNLLTTPPRLLSHEQLLNLAVPCLKDPDALVRLYAAWAIGNFGPRASNAVPELTLALQGSQAGRRKNSTIASRAATANALGSIGPAAMSSVPALTNLLPSADAYLRVQIAAAVWHISSNENISLPILISDLPALDSRSKWGAIRPLGEMESRAKPAFPKLLNELTNTSNDRYILDLITNTLKAIDPEAAAKAGVK